MNYGKLLLVLGGGLALYMVLARRLSAQSKRSSNGTLPPGGRMTAVTVPQYTFAKSGPSAVTGNDKIPIGQASDPTLVQMDDQIIYLQKQLYDLADPNIAKNFPAGMVRTTQQGLRAQLTALVQQRRQAADRITG